MAEQLDIEDGEARDTAILKSHALQLAEHFESVQILVTRHDGDTGQTLHRSWGVGNWYARYGSAKEWLTHKDEQMREEVRNDGE